MKLVKLALPAVQVLTEYYPGTQVQAPMSVKYVFDAHMLQSSTNQVLLRYSKSHSEATQQARLKEQGYFSS